MATVYLAADLKHDRKVAIKVLEPELAAVLGAERFVQEIKITAALNHPHRCSVGQERSRNSASAMSCVRPVARLFLIRSSREIMETSISPRRAGTRRTHASENSTPGSTKRSLVAVTGWLAMLRQRLAEGTGR